MKKLLSLVLILTMVAAVLVGCGSKDSGESDDDNNFKVGVILINDNKDTYTKAHADGILDAAKEVGIDSKNIIVRYNINEDDCAKTAKDLIGNGCSLIVSNSFRHQDDMNKVASEYSDVDFVAVSGDYAAISGNGNFYNAFTSIYEARYVSGVVAGLKIKELADQKKIPKKDFDKNKNVKIGYIGSYPCPEVVSGYTAFYLGIKSVYEKVSMEVFYTKKGYDTKKDTAAAEKLIKDNCLIIGLHSDTKSIPSAIEKAKEEGTTVYSVGYNTSMSDVAEKSSLTSAISNWKVYYKELLQAVKNEEDIPRDWVGGYSVGAVSITELGPEVAKGTDEKVAEVEKGIKDGSIKVFDTSKFTVKGKKIDSYMVDLSKVDTSKKPPKVIYKGEEKEAIENVDGITYFTESTLRSSPYFDLKIDGIKELNAK